MVLPLLWRPLASSWLSLAFNPSSFSVLVPRSTAQPVSTRLHGGMLHVVDGGGANYPPRRDPGLFGKLNEILFSTVGPQGLWTAWKSRRDLRRH
jgi:hypothetical protein